MGAYCPGPGSLLRSRAPARYRGDSYRANVGLLDNGRYRSVTAGSVGDRYEWGRSVSLPIGLKNFVEVPNRGAGTLLIREFICAHRAPTARFYFDA